MKRFSIYFLYCLLAFVFLAMPVRLWGKSNAPKQEKTEIIPVLPEPDLLSVKARPDTPPADNHPARLYVAASSLTKEGIDVSHYQGRIDWEAVAKDANISYVYLKSTEGANLVDDTYERNLLGARRNGLKVGSYHFYRPNTAIEDQFRNFTATAKVADQALLPIIDVEHKGTVSDEKFIRDLGAFLEMVTKHYGKRPIIYTFQNFYNRYLTGKFPQYKWMIAKYQEELPVLHDHQPFIIWQYTSKGSIPGIKGHVDRSVIMDEYSLGEILL